MAELNEEQKELVEKLKILDENIKILWRDTGIVSLIDGLITIPITKNIDEAGQSFFDGIQRSFWDQRKIYPI